MQEVFPRPFGKYELLERIGSGGMAEVFRARLVGLGGFEKQLVIKKMLPELKTRPRSVDMFLAEARLAALVQHRNVVQVFELGSTEDGELFIAMELVEGTDLRRLLRAANAKKLRIPPWMSVYVMSEILDGLAFAHNLKDKEGRPRNVIHRDVSPSNVFISTLGDVKLADFGVAKDSTRESLTLDGQLKGKIPYMSPEQLYHRPLDARADIFAAGTVLWECLAQRRLFGGRPEIEAMNAICKGARVPPSAHVKDIPPELDEAVLRAIEIDRDLRYASAREFQRRLIEILASLRPRIFGSDLQQAVEILLGADHRPEALRSEGSASSGTSHPEVEVQDAQHDTLEISTPSVGPADSGSFSARPGEASLPRYFGEHPFYVRGASVLDTQPLDYYVALAILKSEVETAERLEISVDKTRWHDAHGFARLSGQEAVLRIEGDEYPKKIAFTGSLDTMSLTRALGRIWRERATGRLIISTETGGRRTRRELHVKDGAPTFAYSSSLKLQVPEYLIESKLVTEDEIPELMWRSLSEERPFEAVAAQARGLDVASLREKLMFERMVDAFSWTHGQLILDTRSLEGPEPFAPTVFAPLPAWIERGVSIARLRVALAPHLDKPLVRSKRFARGTRDMAIAGDALRTVQRLGSGEPLIALLRSNPALEPVHLATAYAFVEAELLLPPP